jgi:hypothetical protein
MSGFRDKQRTLGNAVGVPGDAGSSPGKSRGGMACQNMTQQPNCSSYAGPQDITLGLLWPKCTQKEIIKYKARGLSIKNIKTS